MKSQSTANLKLGDSIRACGHNGTIVDRSKSGCTWLIEFDSHWKADLHNGNGLTVSGCEYSSNNCWYIPDTEAH